MSANIRAYVMTRFQRIVCVDHPRIKAKFIVSHQPERPTEYWVSIADMTVWDEARFGGIVFHSGDMDAHVKNGTVSIGHIPERLSAELHGIETDMERVILAATEAFHVEGAIER